MKQKERKKKVCDSWKLDDKQISVHVCRRVWAFLSEMLGEVIRSQRCVCTPGKLQPRYLYAALLQRPHNPTAPPPAQHPPPSFLPPFAYRLQATGPTPATHSPCRPYVDRPPSTATHHHPPHTTPTHPPHHITKHDGRTTTNVSPTRRPQQRLWLQCLPSANGLRGSRARYLTVVRHLKPASERANERTCFFGGL